MEFLLHMSWMWILRTLTLPTWEKKLLWGQTDSTSVCIGSVFIVMKTENSRTKKLRTIRLHLGKHNVKWQHLSQIKAWLFYPAENVFISLNTQPVIFGISAATCKLTGVLFQTRKTSLDLWFNQSELWELSYPFKMFARMTRDRDWVLRSLWLSQPFTFEFCSICTNSRLILDL